ncbi:2-dehydro-3-deoxygalactonokinase [Xanthobacter sp. DSM 24535]|uniref:2-dehydro-3-deoxygalactonokinase n=1 Tax=Roseixanthobacter psychrophilus TaxID=3119917 RepID=UPI00372B3CC7
MSRASLITLDWGTSSLRAYLLGAAGEILARAETAEGLMAVKDRAFAPVLSRIAGPWAAAHGPLPVLLSGMIGSRQGWAEAPYVPCPAGIEDLARALMPLAIEDPALGPVHIVPGLLVDDPITPDVIRGEETEVFGALALTGRAEGLFVLPGTHSKWVLVENGRVTGFATFMTGEIFAALKGHTILGRMMGDAAPSPAGFRAGVAASRELHGPGDLLSRLFTVRALGLTGRLADADSADFLSGLLIGAELASVTDGRETFTLIANAALTQHYSTAADLLALPHDRAPPDCAAAGQMAIARAAGLI